MGGQSTKERRLVSVEEKCSHIDYLEMKAVLFGLHSLCRNSIDKHIRIQSDNSTTEAMRGAKSLDCNEMALQI